LQARSWESSSIELLLYPKLIPANFVKVSAPDHITCYLFVSLSYATNYREVCDNVVPKRDSGGVLMWKVAAFRNGEWSTVRLLERTGVPPSSQTAVFMAQQIQNENRTKLVDHLREEASSPFGPLGVGGSREAIELWSKQAEIEFYEFNIAANTKIESVEEGLAYYATYTTGSARSIPDTLVWHDRTVVVIPIDSDVEEIAIEYEPDLRDENRVIRMQQNATPDHKLETIFEWRGYFGQQSAIIDGWNAMRLRGRNFLTTLRAQSGFLVGFVLRRLSRPQKVLDRDPTYTARLSSMVARYPDIARDIPDLSAAQATQFDAVMVFVHGTVSCGIQNLKDLYPGHIRIPTFRFEHDTFRPLQENGTGLAELVAARLQAKQVYVVGHSRGGLVGRVAKEKLRSLGYGCPVNLVTFGTPHLGTPLAKIGAKMLNLLFKLGSDLVGMIPHATPLALAYSYLLGGTALPPGLDVMREDSDTLALLNAIGDSGGSECWASKFDINAGPSGFGIEIEGILMGALGSVANDLVVPASSALAFGEARPLLSCSHLSYFQQQEVQNFFDSLAGMAVSGGRAFAVAASTSVGQAAPSAGALSYQAEQVRVGNVSTQKQQFR
jgi:hypothetical protein